LSSAIIYKILRPADWRAFAAAGRFKGAPVDLADGFLHFSAPDQVLETLARHFADEDAPMLVACDAAAFGDALKWEPSRGGALFPHLYGVLERRHVLSVTPLARGPNGAHLLPPLP
jgi:uncharacterized protein (DUF952 family)